MRDRVGLWVDPTKAIVVTVPDEGEPMGLTVLGHDSSLKAPGRLKTAMDDGRQGPSTGYINHYYDVVLACIRDAGAILIFGPGETKNELKKRLEQSKIGRRIAGIETADRMTYFQIATSVRQRFAEGVRP